MILQLLRDPVNGVITLLILLPVLIISLTFHEYMHGLAAYAMGDPTPKNSRRLTLNPLNHLDPIGAIALLFAGFGWAKPVPINPYYLKKPKRDMALIAFAGPLSNLLLCFVGLVWFYLWQVFPIIQMPTVVTTAFQYFIILNINLAVFNLIPFPPLDGSKIVFSVLSDKTYYKLMEYEKYGMLALFILLMTGRFNGIISGVSSWILTGFQNFILSVLKLIGVL
ncbi:MAG: site-2 protease family protein [Bacillota bacterium]|nr:site-2 protease family protein [Bacillota bacterium]